MTFDSRQFREELIRRMVRAYKDIKRIDKRLSLRRFHRVSPNPVLAEQVLDEAMELAARRQEALDTLNDSWLKLPEVRQDKSISTGPMEFAAACAVKHKTKRFMSTQRKFQEGQYGGPAQQGS